MKFSHSIDVANYMHKKPIRRERQPKPLLAPYPFKEFDRY
jgi:hypothetical protein